MFCNLGPSFGIMKRQAVESAMSDPQTLIDKIKSLPAERRIEVEDFVDFIAAREQERSLARAASASSEPAFARIWNNPDDDAYDKL
jgi:hypothetical protein